MGHKVGWLTLSAGIAGGADVILLPEIPYDIDKVAKCLNDRIKKGKKFSILAVAEGAISKEEAALTKKERKKARENFPIPPLCTALPRSWPGRLTTKSACASLGTSSGAAALRL